LTRYIVTTRTAKHRIFMFADGKLIAESKIVLIASDDAYVLGVLSGSFHLTFSLREGGWLGVGNDPTYNHTDCFDPFPFPVATENQKERIRALAEELDGLRKKVLAAHGFLTMTKLYNVREKVKSGESLDESERAIHDAGCVSVIHQLHSQIDAAVAEAYGWPADLSDGDILARLVALNKERSEEERSGLIRWLRPAYQAARATMRAPKEEQIEADLAPPDAGAPALPKDDADLVALLRGRLRTIGKPIEPKALAQHFRDGGRGTRRIERGLRLLAAAGVVRRSEAGWFLPLDRAS
jgi:hypothetical protein